VRSGHITLENMRTLVESFKRLELNILGRVEGGGGGLAPSPLHSPTPYIFININSISLKLYIII